MSHDPVLLRDDLLKQNEEYRRLDAQHHEYESRLNLLLDKAVLSDEEQVEEVTLKKRKLQVKDRMQQIARSLREGALHPWAGDSAASLRRRVSWGRRGAG